MLETALADNGTGWSQIWLVLGFQGLLVFLTWVALARPIHRLFGWIGNGAFAVTVALGLVAYLFAGSPDLRSDKIDAEPIEAVWFQAAEALTHDDPNVRVTAAKALIRLLDHEALRMAPTGVLRNDLRIAASWLLRARAYRVLGLANDAQANLEMFNTYHQVYGNQLFDALSRIATPRMIMLP